MKVKSDINELKKVNAELARLNEQAKPLRQRKKELEANVLQYMQSSKNKGIQLPDVEVVTVDKVVHEKLGKNEKEYTAVQLLEQSGVNNARKVYQDLQSIVKGKENITQKLKLKEKK